MLLAAHDDPAVADDWLLTDLEAQLLELGALPPEAVSHFRDRAADVADTLRNIVINTPREQS